jgi:hypothetical protein
MRIKLFLPLLIAGFAAFPGSGRAQGVVEGMNIVNPLRASVPAQNALIEQLAENHVHVVRCGITPDAKGMDFAKRLYAKGIKIELIVSPQYPADAPTRPYQPKLYPDMWSGHPLSYASPELSLKYFQAMLGQLDENGIELAGLELGNEINWAAFNAEFPLPGEGRYFGLDDLYHDPEAKQIAKGYLKYIEILAALNEAREHSSVNRHTPILSAGLADSGAPYSHPSDKEDSVSINATLEFLRKNGMDPLVDAYGIHEYPWEKTAAERKAYMEKNAIAECGPRAGGPGKPCWMTEWGFNNNDLSCPLNDSARALLVQETMDDFRDFVKEGKVTGELYFSWDADPWATTISPGSVYRCGELTKSGHEALGPLDQ